MARSAPSRSLKIARTVVVGFAMLAGSAVYAQEPGWLQDDLTAALKQAKQTGNPVFVVFR